VSTADDNRQEIVGKVCFKVVYDRGTEDIDIVTAPVATGEPRFSLKAYYIGPA